jgi:hypothetical protein
MLVIGKELCGCSVITGEEDLTGEEVFMAVSGDVAEGAKCADSPFSSSAEPSSNVHFSLASMTLAGLQSFH